MDDVEIVLERHEQKIKTLERDMTAMKEVQAEIRSMNETLVTLATELKHTNEKDEFEEMDGDDHIGHQLSC